MQAIHFKYNSIMIKGKANIPSYLLLYLFLIIITIVVQIIAPKSIAIIWYITLLLLYLRSKDEAFWLAFFFVTVDGFLGFLGSYSLLIKALPGLPGIEVAQFYVIISIIKANQTRAKSFVYYNGYLKALFVYLIFLIIWGQLMGFSGGLNDYFRIFKLTFPLFLFYSIPRLFNSLDSFERFFKFIFIILIVAFAAQIFNLITGISPSESLILNEQQIAESGEYRGFYNSGATFLGAFGALYYLSCKSKSFNSFYLYIILVCAFGMAFLSATRGWILAIGFIILMNLIFVQKLSFKRILGFSSIIVICILAGFNNQKIKKQVNFTYDRLMTLEDLVDGDVTAGGTLTRINYRAPRVMKKWFESPIFGWGFSDAWREYEDGHVGNQSILLHAGVVGFSLLIGFLLFFCLKLFFIFQKLPQSYTLQRSIITFIIMLLGWFFLHSSSGQSFRFAGLPAHIIPQAVFFSFGALIYAKSVKFLREQTV